ncbi:tetratricopeptide repeat protein [Flavobacterium hungaricum]|uniref:Tetratricopeptide repeat protein n=1 Tax=Flavobacterium hungaricum TaxID=2082725 RepID=A0ABR9TDV7_9FLAO|nr:tetratricopeptide repeat protein [Flavobacterium hungaricum]MBE8723553.1 tetratricopeptide repeat protein [Flavobacterium hungaricum]
MKHIILKLVLIIFTCNLVNAQKLKKTETITKSTNPLEINTSIDFEINASLDSTTVSKETFAILKEVQPLLDKEENEKAYQLLSYIDEKDLEKNEILILKGIVALRLNDLATSSSFFSRYLPSAPNDSLKSSIYYMLGVIDLQRNFKISANLNFEKSYELDQKNISTLLILGNNSFEKNDFEKAIFYYEKLVEVNPNKNNVWNNLGFLYQQLGQHEKAKKVFSKIIKEEPDAPLPYNNRSYCNLQLGLIKQALEDVNKSIKLFPENSYAFRNRALVYIKMKDFKKACADIETAFKLGYTEKYGFDLDAVQSENCKK